RSNTVAEAYLRLYLQVIQFLRDRGFSDAVQKLANAGMCAGAHFFRGAQRNDVTFIDEDHAVGDEKSAGELMRHNDDRHVKRLLEFENEFVDSSGDDGIEAGGRLVEKKNFGIHGEGAGDGCALFHS